MRDHFETASDHAVCPDCGRAYLATFLECPECGEPNDLQTSIMDDLEALMDVGRAA